MKIFRLKNSVNATWHISLGRENSRDYSLCGNAGIKACNVHEALTKKSIDVEPFNDNARLCPSCVMQAYKLGLVNIKRVEEM